MHFNAAHVSQKAFQVSFRPLKFCSMILWDPQRSKVFFSSSFYHVSTKFTREIPKVKLSQTKGTIVRLHVHLKTKACNVM